jgi:hypothetical protein
MKNLSKIERLVLEAASDDFENLEHIYRSISLEFSAKKFKPADPNSFYWREAVNAPPLTQIADAIKILASEGFLESRTESGTTPSTEGDSAFVWRAWFHTTKDAMSLLRSSE